MTTIIVDPNTKTTSESVYRAGINPKDCIVSASLCDEYTDNNVKIYEL